MAKDEETQVGELDTKEPAVKAEVKPEPAPPEPAAAVDPQVDRPRDVIYEATVTSERAADIGSGTVASPVSESILHTDHVIPHYEEDSDRYSTLGQSPAAPLPLAGAGGNALKPEDVFGR